MPTRAQAKTCPGNFDIVPIERLCTSYARLRPGRPKRPRSKELAALPLRVVPIQGDRYEVIDGFKRLAVWREEGYRQIPVVLEAEGPPEEHKQMLLLANAPPRTITAADEAEVVASLKQEDRLSERHIAHALSKTRRWVARRLEIERSLGATAKQWLEEGKLGPAAAHTLCGLPDKDQKAVLGAVEQYRLTATEAVHLFSAFRVADTTDQKKLLADPKGELEPDRSPALSPVVQTLERKLERIRNALLNLAHFQIPSELAPAERRRLEAVLHSVLHLLHQIARALLPDRAPSQEEHDVRRRRASCAEVPREEKAGQRGPRGGPPGDDPP